MLAPVERLKKDEIIWLKRNRCRHGHTYLEHFQCLSYDSNSPIKERVGYLDLESSNLSADYGYVICYCIKKPHGKIISNRITKKEILSGIGDKRLIHDFVRDAVHFDRLISYYGSGFDIPFLRSRAAIHGINFPSHSEIRHTDVWMIIKHKYKFHRNSLKVACEALNIKSKEHPLKPGVWLKAMAGHEGTLKYILKHCQEDVISLELLHDKVITSWKRANTSI